MTKKRSVRVVAIDGPAGAGKSTLARAVAVHLGVERLDTGAMYRSVAWAALRAQIDPSDQGAIGQLARRLDIVVDGRTDGRGTVTVDGVDATAGIRTPEVDAVVSAVAANPEVRTELVGRQRAWVAQHAGGVVEGRDIGTVVLPDADVKVYLTAASMARAERRATERGDAGSAPDVAAAMARRDELDSTRALSPLPGIEDVPADAVVIDSTDKDADEVFEEVLRCL